MTLDPTGIITYATVTDSSLVGSAIEYKVSASLELYPDVTATEKTFTVTIGYDCDLVVFNLNNVATSASTFTLVAGHEYSWSDMSFDQAVCEVLEYVITVTDPNNKTYVKNFVKSDSTWNQNEGSSDAGNFG